MSCEEFPSTSIRWPLVSSGENSNATFYRTVGRLDSKLTVEQVKKTAVEKRLFRLFSVGMMLIFLLGILALITYAGEFPDEAQKALSQGEFLGY